MTWHDKKTVKVTLVKSPIGTQAEPSRDGARPRPAQASTSVASCDDTPAVRGMINKVDYLVKVLRS